MTQLPSWSDGLYFFLGGFSCPNLRLVFLNLLFLGTRYIFFRKCWDFPCGFFCSFFSVPYFALACDHGNSFFCFCKSKKEKVYWIEVRTVFNVKTTLHIIY